VVAFTAESDCTLRRELQVVVNEDRGLRRVGEKGDRLDVHGFVHIMQRRFGDLAGPSATLGHNVVQVRGIFTQARTCVPHRRHAFDDAIGNELLAIDTADGGGPAFGINLLLNHR